MDLFEQSAGELNNILPKDGEVNYYGKIISSSAARFYFERLFETIEWENDQAFVLGKIIHTKRKVAWYGDQAFQYTYSGTTKIALPWTPELTALKSLVEKESHENFNACLLNLYHDGSEGMTWHCDNEVDLKKNAAIASLSLGTERKFCFKHKKTKDLVSLFLADGSLLIMKDDTQKNWLHRLPPTKTVNNPRINLTFRTMMHA
jgi:alkylated DNA repair dioxygenase AlkB